MLEVLDEKEPLSEMRRIGVACQLFADIVDHYGATDEKHMPRQDSEIVTEIVQYIYDHYQENITLESLGKVFYMSPKVLSNKLKKRLNVDLRVFVNDIRVQMVIQLRNDPQYKDKTLQQIATSCGFNCMSTFYRSYERNYSFQELSNEPKKQPSEDSAFRDNIPESAVFLSKKTQWPNKDFCHKQMDLCNCAFYSKKL